MYIQLPSEFNTKNNEGNLTCSSYESSTLIDNKCTLKYINGLFMLYTDLDSTSQTSFSIITNFVNPINNTYQASVYVMSKGVKYAATPNEPLTILSNSFQNGSRNDITLMNNPKEGGLMATYILK